jgi:7-cyano-7-deazaguanine synthase in queuosine biosynthesis
MSESSPTEDKRTKNVLLGWSGGLDSTRLILHYRSLGWNIDAIYCILKNNPEKTERELAARKAIMEQYFHDWVKPAFNLRHGHTSIDLGAVWRAPSFSQVVPWLLTLFMNVAEDHDEVALGYICGDDAISYLDEIKAVWNSFNGISKFQLPPLVFPLMKKTKPEIYWEIPEGIRGLTTWCESANKEDNCGECIPCRKMLFYELRESSAKI